MRKLWLALILALLALPAVARADDNTSAAAVPPTLTPAQRQAISTTVRAFRDKEKQMHQQLRSQILGSLSPDHRTAVANVIGQMVISASPDPDAAAKQIDAVLSPAERQSILAAHGTFVTQTQTLMQQMHAQLQKELPAGASGHMHGGMGMSSHSSMDGAATDAGTVLMLVLAHHGPMGMGDMDDHHPGTPGMEGAQPPNGPPGGGPPPPPQ